MRAAPARPVRRTGALAAASAWLLAAAAVPAWPAVGGLAAQEPADSSATADSAVVVPASGDSALQTRLDSARRSERARRNAVIRSLRPGDSLRVRAGGRTVDGRFLRLSDGHLFLRRGDGPGEEGVAARADSTLPPGVEPIPVDAMEALWIRLGRADAGALWGGIVGTLGGAVGGYFINEALCADAEDCIFDSGESAVVFGIGGGLAGVGFGALIGRSVKEWRQWFPEEGAPPRPSGG